MSRGLGPLLCALQPAFDGGVNGTGTDCPLPSELLVSVVAAAVEALLSDHCGDHISAPELDSLRRFGRLFESGSGAGDDDEDDDDDHDDGGELLGLCGSFFWRVAEQCVDDFDAIARGERKSLAARKDHPKVKKAVGSAYWKDRSGDDIDARVPDAIKAFATGGGLGQAQVVGA